MEECTFKPNIGPSFSLGTSFMHIQSREISPESMYLRTIEWKEKISAKVLEKRKEMLREQTRPIKPINSVKAESKYKQGLLTASSKNSDKMDIMEYEICEANQIFECLSHNFIPRERIPSSQSNQVFF